MAKRQHRAKLCPICGGRLRQTTITHEEKRGSKLYLFQNVPAEVCASCGEIWLAEATLKTVDDLIERGQPTDKIETPVYDLAIAASQ